jgi:membrane carboxypeptidase/penicillin-binding protein
MLTGISLAPALNPWNSAAGAVSLQQQVLRQLAALGLLSDAELQAALLEEVRVLPEPTDSKPRTEFVQNALQEAEKKYGEDRVNRGGMVIRTAQDSYQQGQADCLTTSLRGMVEGSGESVTCQAAVELPLLPPFQPLPSGSLSYELVVLDPASGEVLALAQAGAESSTQPAALGSLVTPFIYLNAFAEGSGPASLVWDVTGNPIDAPWQDADELGPESARAALNRDDLAPAAQMLLTGGDASMSRLASLLGFTSDVGGDPLAYSGGITAAARAYAMLANSGQIPAAASFLTTDESIDTGGAGDEAALAVVSRQLAYLVSDSLSDLAERTAAAKLAVRASGNESLAVKIGSVGNGTAAWAVVYSPGRVILTRISGVNLADGARVDENWAAALAGAMEQAASLRQPAKTWQEPAGISRVVVCVPAGLLPGLDCQQQRAEIFLAGNEPVNLDNLYQSAEVNRENGLLATVFTPPELTQQQRFLNVPPEYQAWADSQYLPPLPHEYDTAQPPAPADGTVIRLPEMYATVNGEVSITGDAFGDAFASYRLDYGQGLNPLTWVQIGQNGTEPMQGELLAVWDTAGLQGLYTLRLQVLGADARLQEHMVVVTVRP